MAGTEELADGVEVVGGAGHDVAGAVGLVERGGLALEIGEDVVAEVVFDFAGGADDDLAGDVEEDAGDGREADELGGVKKDFVRGGGVAEVVDGLADNNGKDGAYGVVDDDGDAAPGELVPVTPKVGEEGAEAIEHGDLMLRVPGGFVAVLKALTLVSTTHTDSSRLP